MNAGTTLNARDSTTIALFSVPDPNWSGPFISEIATGPTSTFSVTRDGAVKTPYPSSTCDDDIRYGGTPTLTPSPSGSEPTMTTAIAAGSSSPPTGESAFAVGASALEFLDAVPPLSAPFQWLQFSTVFAGGNTYIYDVLVRKRCNSKRRNRKRRNCKRRNHHCDKKSTYVLSHLTPRWLSWMPWLWSWSARLVAMSSGLS